MGPRLSQFGPGETLPAKFRYLRRWEDQVVSALWANRLTRICSHMTTRQRISLRPPSGLRQSSAAQTKWDNCDLVALGCWVIT